MAKISDNRGYTSARSITISSLGAKSYWARYQTKVVNGQPVNLSPEEAKTVEPVQIGTVMGRARFSEYKEEQHPQFGLVKTYMFEGFFEARSSNDQIGVIRAPKFFPPFSFGAEIHAILEEAKKKEPFADVSFIVEVWVRGTGRSIPVEYYAKPRSASAYDPFKSLREQAISVGALVEPPSTPMAALSGPDDVPANAETGELFDDATNAAAVAEAVTADKNVKADHPVRKNK